MLSDHQRVSDYINSSAIINLVYANQKLVRRIQISNDILVALHNGCFSLHPGNNTIMSDKRRASAELPLHT